MKIESLNKKILELEKKVDGKFDNGLSGAIIDRFIICGKEGCKCKKGVKHGPYPHIQTYDKDKILRGIYIGNKKVGLYSKKLEENKEFIEDIKELNRLYLLKRKIK